MSLKLHPSWESHLSLELKSPYMQELLEFLALEEKSGKKIYPPKENVFEAFRLTPFEDVKVVIIGQDPYHGEGQAHGLCFSVQKNVKIPPSLVNIFKELESDLGIKIPKHGCLESWARQGVLLLNNVLTVEEGKAGSHHQKGWEKFTDKVIEILNQEKENLVFILWGSPAQKKARNVDEKKHLVLKSVHPSPLSVYRGFLGSKPFSQANAYLKKKGVPEINWSILPLLFLLISCLPEFDRSKLQFEEEQIQESLKPLDSGNRFQELKEKIIVPHCLRCHKEYSTEEGVLKKVKAKNPEGSKFFTMVEEGLMPEDGPALGTLELEIIRNYINSI